MEPQNKRTMLDILWGFFWMCLLVYIKHQKSFLSDGSNLKMCGAYLVYSVGIGTRPSSSY